MNRCPDEFAALPTVYAVRNTYQIIVPVKCETVMWVSVGDKCFYDDSNGILRSSCSTHRMTVPAELLDREKKYTVCYRVIRERKPYFTEADGVLCYTSVFHPIEKSPVNIYHIADAHNRVNEPVAAGSYFGGELDLLILNGDIPNHSGDISYFTAIHEIAARLTGGEKPVIFSRGNHDTRGIYAEKLEDYTPTDGGRSYYTFRVGHIWGIVLDCGEDKPDDHPEYGHTVCCEDFRRRETEYIREVIRNCKSEYEADGVSNRLVVCHVPFTEKFQAPFDIEEDVYSVWSELLREHVRPQLMLCGHMHEAYISDEGSEKDYQGQPCTVAVASQVGDDGSFAGGAVRLYREHCEFKLTDNEGKVLLEKNIFFKKTQN